MSCFHWEFCLCCENSNAEFLYYRNSCVMRVFPILDIIQSFFFSCKILFIIKAKIRETMWSCLIYVNQRQPELDKQTQYSDNSVLSLIILVKESNIKSKGGGVGPFQQQSCEWSPLTQLIQKISENRPGSQFFSLNGSPLFYFIFFTS